MTVNEISLTTLNGRETTFGEFAGKAVLVVNVASRCGLSPQYEALEALQKKYGDRGFTVLGVPSNQFLQELKTSDDIAEYCSATWGVVLANGEIKRFRPTTKPDAPEVMAAIESALS